MRRQAGEQQELAAGAAPAAILCCCHGKFAKPRLASRGPRGVQHRVRPNTLTERLLGFSALTPPPAPDAAHETLLEFPDNRVLIDLCGEHDRNLAQIEQRLNVQIIRRGNQLAVMGPRADRSRAVALLQALYSRIEAGRAGRRRRDRRPDPAWARRGTAGGRPADDVPRRHARAARPARSRSSRGPRRRRPMSPTCSSTNWPSASARRAPARPISRSRSG